MFIVAALLLLSLVILSVVYPVFKKGTAPIAMGLEAEREQERVDLEIERLRVASSLSDLETERAQGRLTEPDYHRLRAADERQLLRVLDRLEEITKAEPAPSKKQKAGAPAVAGGLPGWAVTIALGTVVAVGAYGLYSAVDSRIGMQAKRIAAEQQAQAGPGGMPNPAEMVARLEARLRDNPDDLQGQMMAGRSYIALGRMADAKKAWAKVLELDKRSHEAHYNLGLILLQTGDRSDTKVLEEALGHLDTALVNVPREPAVLWFRGVALVHLKRYGEADQSWTTAYQNLTPGSEDAEFVRKALEDLRSGRLEGLQIQ
jgi:cytochrome c-type biogenesis protein CcmH